jgi:hypothetical protein
MLSLVFPESRACFARQANARAKFSRIPIPKASSLPPICPNLFLIKPARHTFFNESEVFRILGQQFDDLRIVGLSARKIITNKVAIKVVVGWPKSICNRLEICVGVVGVGHDHARNHEVRGVWWRNVSAEKNPNREIKQRKACHDRQHDFPQDRQNFFDLHRISPALPNGNIASTVFNITSNTGRRQRLCWHYRILTPVFPSFFAVADYRFLTPRKRMAESRKPQAESSGNRGVENW